MEDNMNKKSGCSPHPRTPSRIHQVLLARLSQQLREVCSHMNARVGIDCVRVIPHVVHTTIRHIFLHVRHVQMVAIHELGSCLSRSCVSCSCVSCTCVSCSCVSRSCVSCSCVSCSCVSCSCVSCTCVSCTCVSCSCVSRSLHSPRCGQRSLCYSTSWCRPHCLPARPSIWNPTAGAD